MDAGKPRLVTPTAGFVLKTKELKSNKKVFVNVVASDLVRSPINAAGDTVPESHLDARGMHSLRVPLDVNEPAHVKDKSGEPAIAVDVIFHPWVVQRALTGHATDYFKMYLSDLAMKWVAETLNATLEKPGRFLNMRYKGGVGPKGDQVRPFCLAGEDDDAEDAGNDANDPDILPGVGSLDGIRITDDNERITSDDMRPVSSVKLADGAPSPTAGASPSPAPAKTSTSAAAPAASKPKKKGPPVVKKGFFANQKEALYPNGSTEGTLPPGAGDPMGWMPPKLRSMVHVVDPSAQGDQNTMQAAMEQYANTGKVASAPGIHPGGVEAQQSSAAPAAAAPPPPAAANQSKSLPLPTVHVCTVCEAVLMTVELPQVTSMAEVDLDISAVSLELSAPPHYGLLRKGWGNGIKVDVDRVKAKFSKRKKELAVTAPILALVDQE
jgi:hypothetical protein